LPPVEVIRTVVAVTAPVLLAGPNALTQSPTASADDATVSVCDSVVVEEVVILSFSVFAVGFFAGFFFDDDEVGLNVWLSTVPESEIVVPDTPVTFPLAMVKLAPENPRRPPAPPGKLPLGGVSPEPERLPLPAGPAPAPPAPPANLPPPPNPPAARPPKPDAHVPDDVAVLIVMDRAATVVLDFFDGVPVTVRQSPTATALRVCVAVSEKVVVAVQLTEVWPSVVLCTSIVVPSMEATLPLAPMLEGAAAAPALTVAIRTTQALRPAVTAERAPQCPSRP
jgi:hypothetical protein